MSRTRRTKTIHLRTTERPKRERRPDPVPCIIELHADGFVQVYGPRHLRVVIINRMDVDDDPVAIRATMATLAEEYHTLELPRPHREFYGTNHVLATGNVCRRTPESDRRRKESLDFIGACRQFHDEHVAPKREKETVS